MQKCANRPSCFSLISREWWKRCQWCFSVCPSVEQVQRRNCRLFRLLYLWLGQLNTTHRNHSTDSKVNPNAADPKPERPVQIVFQDNEDEEVLPIIRHPLCETVVSHSCQETQNTQGTKNSWKQKREDIRQEKHSGRGMPMKESHSLLKMRNLRNKTVS